MEQAQRRGRFAASDDKDDDQPFKILPGARVTLSPNGEWVMQHFPYNTPSTICQFGSSRKAYICTNRGQHATIMETQLHTINTAVWSPDSRRLVFGGQACVYVYVPATHRRMKVRIPWGDVYQIWWLEDKSFIVATRNGHIAACYVYDDHDTIAIHVHKHTIKRSKYPYRLAFGDGAIAVASREDETIQVQNATGLHTFAPSGLSMLCDMAISRAGNCVIATAPEGVLICDTLNETSPMILNDEFKSCDMCAISPNGNTFAFTNKEYVFTVVGNEFRLVKKINPPLTVVQLYFTGDKVLVVVFRDSSDESVKVARFDV